MKLISLCLNQHRFWIWLTAKKGGQRALALLQVGNTAARELRYLAKDAACSKRDLISFSTQHDMPGLAFRLADFHQKVR